MDLDRELLRAIIDIEETTGRELERIKVRMLPRPFALRTRRVDGKAVLVLVNTETGGTVDLTGPL